MSATSQSAPAPTSRARWVAMSILLVAGFMNLMDVTIVNVALPSLQRAFSATPEQIEWVVAVYIVVFALCLIPGGRFGDIFGRRNVFVIGVVVFTIGSALCGLAPSIEALVGARIVQGIGGALMIPQTLALVPAIFPPEERGAAFALFGLSAGLASVSGPLLGGLLIGADIWGLDWRPIFLVNIPVGIMAVVLALRFLPTVERRRDLGIDGVGIVLAGATLLLVIFPLIEGRALGWPLWIFAMMAGALPMAGLFAAWQRRQSARGGAVLLPAALLANRPYLLGVVITALLFSGIPGFFLIFAIFLQTGFGLTPLQSGITTVPFSVGVLIASGVAGRLGNRMLRTRITTGAWSMAAGLAGLWIVLSQMQDVVVQSWFIAPLLLAGFGLGTSISPLFNTVLSSVEGREAGSASGALQAFQQVGGAFGVAVTGQIFFSLLEGAQPGSQPALYERAFAAGLLYPIAAFALLGAAVWLLPPPKAVKTREGFQASE